MEALSEGSGQFGAFIQCSCNSLRKMVIMAFILVISVAIAKTQFAIVPSASCMRALGVWYSTLLGSPMVLNDKITFREKTEGFFFSQNKWSSMKCI